MFKRMVLPRSFLKCITKKKEAQKRQNFVFLNCSVVNQRQWGIAMTDSLTESITKVVIHTWLQAECYLVHYKNVSLRKECLKNT